MGKVKSLLVLFFLVTVTGIKAQTAEDIRPGFLLGRLTLSPSYMFSGKGSYFYLHGSIEGHVAKKISLAGEGYYSLGALSPGNSTFDHNHNGFFGVNWHFTKKNNDLYIGFQPGLSVTKLNAIENDLIKTQSGINPLVSAVAGYNFYPGKIFHFFIQARIITGQHNYDIRKDLTELRISAGLGFNTINRNRKR